MKYQVCSNNASLRLVWPSVNFQGREMQSMDLSLHHGCPSSLETFPIQVDEIHTYTVLKLLAVVEVTNIIQAMIHVRFNGNGNDFISERFSPGTLGSRRGGLV